MNRNTFYLVTSLDLKHPLKPDFLNSNMCFCSQLYGIFILEPPVFEKSMPGSTSVVKHAHRTLTSTESWLPYEIRIKREGVQSIGEVSCFFDQKFDRNS